MRFKYVRKFFKLFYTCIIMIFCMPKRHTFFKKKLTRVVNFSFSVQVKCPTTLIRYLFIYLFFVTLRNGKCYLSVFWSNVYTKLVPNTG